jgi:hypothetical protein
MVLGDMEDYRACLFFECPANARIARQSLAAIGRPFKGGNDDGHRETSSPSAATIRQPTAS